MLSKTQIEKIAQKVNAKVNIPILSEKAEERILEKVLTKIDDLVAKNLPPALADVWNKLDDGITKEEADELGDEVTKIVNEKINIPLLNEEQEARVFDTVIDTIFEVVADKIDEKVIGS